MHNILLQLKYVTIIFDEFRDDRIDRNLSRRQRERWYGRKVVVCGRELRGRDPSDARSPPITRYCFFRVRLLLSR